MIHRSDNLIQVFCLLSAALGVAIGFMLRYTVGRSPVLEEWIKIPGNILIIMLKMFAVPLIVTSVLAGVTGLHNKMSRKAGLITGIFVVVSTMYSAVYGMCLALIIKPGHESEFAHQGHPGTTVPFSMHVVFMDLLRNMVPESFIQAFFEQYKTEVLYLSRDQIVTSFPQNDSEMLLVGDYVPGANLTGITFWAFTIGLLLNKVGDDAKTTLRLIQALNDAVKIIVLWFMWYLPFGVFFLIADSVMSVDDWGDAFKLVKFAGLVCMAYVHFICFNFVAKLRSLLMRQTFQGFLFLPMIFFLITRRNPFPIYKQISKAIITAFIVASSTVTLPVALQCCEENVKVNKKLLRLMLPITVSINMSGTTLYEVMASIFIAQINFIKLEANQIIGICLSSAIISFGTSGVPTVGGAITIMVLTSVGLPADDVVHLVVIEWLLDHINTTINVLTNMMGVITVHYLYEADVLALEDKLRLDKVRTNNDLELDLTCLEPDDDPIPSAAPPSQSISPN